MNKWKDYRAEYEDENFEIIHEKNDHDALKEAFKLESEHGILFNLFEVNEDSENIRTVL